MDNNVLLGRIAGALGCDLVTGTSEFTARRGRICSLVSNEADSRILNVTEERPANAPSQLKTTAVVTGRTYMSVKRVDTVTLTGTGGTANVLCNAVTKLATFASTLTVTASNFVTAWAADYLAAGVVLTSNGVNLVFTAVVAGTNFTGSTTITNASDDLAGTVAATTANVLAAVNDNKLLFPDYPLTKFTPAKGSFWVFYNYE